MKEHVTSPAADYCPHWDTNAHSETCRDTHSLTCSFPQDNLWRRRSSWFWDDRLWRHCSQSGRRRLISVFHVCAVGLCAFMLCGWEQMCLISNLGDVRDTHNFRLHSMARSILNSGRLMKPSAFSSCRHRQMESGGTSSTQRTKCHTYWYTNFILDSSTLVKHMKQHMLFTLARINSFHHLTWNRWMRCDYRS